MEVLKTGEKHVLLFPLLNKHLMILVTQPLPQAGVSVVTTGNEERSSFKKQVSFSRILKLFYCYETSVN